MAFWTNLSANRKIIKRLSEVEEAAEGWRKAHRTLEALELEFSGLWGKVNTAMSRIEKRASLAEKLSATLADRRNPEEEDPEPSLESPSEGTLTPQQLQWQRRIMRERGRSA